MKTKKTFQNSSETFAREQRLVFESANNAGADAGGESGEKEFSTDWEKYSSDKEFEKGLDELVKQGRIDEQRKKELLANGREKRRQAEAADKKKSREKKMLAKIDELKEKKKKQEEIAENTIESFKKGYLDTVEKLREDVRAQIKELGIEFDEKDEKVAQEFDALAEMIFGRVESLLDKNNYTEMLQTIEEDKKRAQRCYEKLGKYFRDKKRKDFLRLLQIKNIPAGEKMDINSLIALSESYERGKEWSDNTMIINIVQTNKLRDLELSLDAVEKLYSKWDSTGVQKHEKIEKDLAEYAKQLTTLDSDVKTSSRQSEFEKIVASSSDLNWNDLLARKKTNLAQLQKLFADDASQDNLRLIRACLDGNKEEAQKLEETLANLEKMPSDEAEMQKAEKTAESEEIVAPTEKEDETEEKGNRIISAAHAEHGPTTFDKINKNLQKFFTANGKITWYSLHDIAGAFKLIKESWTKHTESKSEDKRGPLGEGLMFWRPEIQRRVELQDQLNEKNRASELREHYKNKKHVELLAGLSWSAPHDRRRIILEILAERGNLRMSDKKLIDIICRGMFKKEDWEKADEIADYTRMREAFKAKIDAPHTGFIGEIGYADELFNKQGSGSETAAGAGEKLSGSSETISAEAELGIFDLQRQKTLHGGSEGEAELVGMLKTMVKRGNAYSNNGSFNEIKIKTEKGEEEVRRNSDQGLVGLMMVDAYLRGNMSRDQIGEIGKKHESGFNPYSCTSDVIANHKTDHPTIAGKKISKFEQWGWIKETIGGRGFITELGKSEIIKFFNTRNARAEIAQADGNVEKKLIHIAIDSKAYKAHSSRHTTLNSARKQSIEVGDKLASYLVKKSAIGLFDTATKLNEHEGYAALTEMRDITSLLKAGVEDFIDGAEMMEKRKNRFYEKFTGKDLELKNGEWMNNAGKIISAEKRTSYGQERMQRGRDILVTMLHNLWRYRADREVTQIHAQYNFYERDKTGLSKKETFKECNLKDFIEKSLRKWSDTSEYDEIMKKVNHLYNEKELLTNDEVREVYQHHGEIENRDDLEKQRRGQKQKKKAV